MTSAVAIREFNSADSAGEAGGTKVPWYALLVKPRREKHVAKSLEHKGFREFLPTYQARRRWSDRVSQLDLPLFPGYVFCPLDLRNRLQVLTTPGVKEIVGTGKVPVPIDESEIAAIQAVVQSGLASQPHPPLETGQRVLLEDGPLAGLEGILTQTRKQERLVISVKLLQRSVSVEIDRGWAKPVRRP